MLYFVAPVNYRCPFERIMTGETEETTKALVVFSVLFVVISE